MAVNEPPFSQSGKAAQEIARACAQEAGQIIRRGFGRPGRITAKGRGNFLTEADLEVERAVLEILGSEYPDHTVLSEETAAETKTEGWLWVIDPVDGTHNYSRGVPHIAFNLALCFDGEPVLGLTYDPVRHEEFFALKGIGAVLNGERLRVSEAVDMRSSLIGTDLGYREERGAHILRLFVDLWPGMQGLRIMGSAALGLAYVAAGRLDLLVHHSIYPWDIAAGILLIQEAGGVVRSRDGGPVTILDEGIVAGAPKVVEDFLERARNRPWRD